MGRILLTGLIYNIRLIIGNTGLLRKDYALLDTILPDWIKSVEEWMRKARYTGEFKSLLKDQADRATEGQK